MKKSKSLELAKIKAEIDKLQLEVDSDQLLVKKKNDLILKHKDRIVVLKKQKDQLEHGGDKVTVSDHALLRCLERIYNIPVETLRQSISDKITPVYNALGVDGNYTMDDDIRLVIRNKNVVTMIDIDN